MADHYVDSAAAPGGDGSYETPWDTISDVNNHVFVADDFIYFKRGSTWTGTNLIIEESGTTGHPITYSVYEAGNRPIIAGTGEGSYCANNHDITIEHIYFKYGASGAIWVVDTYNVILSDVEASDATGENILAFGHESTPVLHDILITGCIAHDGDSCGIMIAHDSEPDPPDYQTGAYNITIEYCTAYNNGIQETQDHGIYMAWVTNGIISHCESYGNYAHGIACRASETPWRIQYNFCHDNGLNGIELSGLVTGTSQTDCKCIYNICYNNGGNPSTQGAGIWLAPTNKGWTIENNTLVNNLWHSVYFWADTDYPTATFKNNILLQDGDVCNGRPYEVQSASTISNSTISYNCVYHKDGDGYVATVAGTAKTWTQWKALTGTPDAVGSINSDPLLVDEVGGEATDYKLQSGSPCQNIGADVSLTEDYWGTSVPQGAAPDIGAHEYPEAGGIERLKRYTGAAFVSGKLIVYQGGTWQQRPVKRWSGTAWVDVDALGG